MTEKKEVGRPRIIKTPEELISGVYALLDPDNGAIRYRGQSKDINKRFKKHCQSASGYPVSNWVKKLQRNNKHPDLIIIEQHDSPLFIEKEWIDRAKRQGVNLLNIHEGGSNPDHAIKNKACKLWNVEGLKTPYTLVRNKYFPFILRNKSIASKFKQLSKERRECKTDEQTIDFEIKMATIGHTFKDLELSIETWLVSVEGDINRLYPDKIKLVYANS